MAAGAAIRPQPIGERREMLFSSTESAEKNPYRPKYLLYFVVAYGRCDGQIDDLPLLLHRSRRRRNRETNYRHQKSNPFATNRIEIKIECTYVFSLFQ